MALDSTDVFRRCAQLAPAAALLAYANDRRRTQSPLRTVRHVPFVVNVLHIVGLVGGSLAKRGSFRTEERALRTQDRPLLYGSAKKHETWAWATITDDLAAYASDCGWNLLDLFFSNEMVR